MAIRTAGDLIEELDGYGAHLPVKLVVSDDAPPQPLVVTDTTLDGEVIVVIEREG